jgi:hypothetical protein
MNNNHLKRQLIHHLAEQGVPDDYDPWEAVKKQLDQKTIQHSSLDSPMKIDASMHFAGALTLLLVVLVGLVFFLTPQGQVTAKNLFQLFQKAESNILPLPTGLPTEPILPRPTRTPAPTQIVSVQPAAPDEAGLFPTPASPEKSEHGAYTVGLTIPEAEALAKYKIRTLKYLPHGYQLTQVIYDGQTRGVQQLYKFYPVQSGEMFVLRQQPSQPAEPVGQSAEIEQIQVGDSLVEVVSGAWFSAAGSATQEWTSNAPVYTYMWQQDGFYFTLQFMAGDTFSPAYLSKEDMQAVVETATGTRTTPLEKVNLNNLPGIDEVKKAAPFQVLAPTLLPEGFVLERGVYEPENQRAVLIYRPGDSASGMNHASLILFEIPKNGDTPPASYAPEWPTEAIEQVTIGGAPGTFTRGSVEDGKYIPSSDLSLHWETDDLRITINFSGSSSDSAQLDQDGMIQIAEGLK